MKDLARDERALVLRQVAVLLRRGASAATAVRAVGDRMPAARAGGLLALADALDRADPFADEVDPSLVALARAEETGPEPLERVAETLEDALFALERVRTHTRPLFLLAASALLFLSGFAFVSSWLEGVWAGLGGALPVVTVLGINSVALVPWIVPPLAVALVVAWRRPALPWLPGGREVALVGALRDFAAAAWSGSTLERAGEVVGARDGDLMTAADELKLDERERALLAWLLARHEPPAAAVALADAVDRGALAVALRRRAMIFFGGVAFACFVLLSLVVSYYLPLFTIAGSMA